MADRLRALLLAALVIGGSAMAQDMAGDRGATGAEEIDEVNPMFGSGLAQGLGVKRQPAIVLSAGRKVRVRTRSRY